MTQLNRTLLNPRWWLMLPLYLLILSAFVLIVLPMRLLEIITGSIAVVLGFLYEIITGHIMGAVQAINRYAHKSK